MRGFEGGKDRFWEIRRDRTTVQTGSGKLGTDGKASAPGRLASAAFDEHPELAPPRLTEAARGAGE